jgi:succinate dehydrogenase flavin-adding protein (antitoxin of CptAB toxin-antitoxin module)
MTVAEEIARPQPREERLKRMSFRAWRRGFREADMVLGPFVDRIAVDYSDAQLDQLEALMANEDQPLYGWIIEREPAPAEFETPVLTDIRAFMAEHVAVAVQKGIG